MKTEGFVLDNENKNEELFDGAQAVDETDLLEPAEEQASDEPAGEQTVEEQTVERLQNLGDEISAEDLGGIPVTPPEDDESDEAAAAELCVMCGEKPADKSFGEDYDLCADCRKLLIKTPLSFASILVLILLVGVGLFGLLLTTTQLSTLHAVSTAYDYAQNKHYYSAIQSLQQGGYLGWKTARNALTMYDASGYLGGINSTVSTYFYDAKSAEKKLTWADKVGRGNLNAPWNKKAKEIYTSYNEAMGAYEKYYAYLSEYDEKLYYGEIDVKDVPYDDLIKKYEAAKTSEKESAGLAFLNYCEWYLADMCEKDVKVQLDCLKAVEQARPDYTWLYLTKLTELQVSTGDYEAAEANCKKMLEINADDFYGEYYRAMILRRQGKYDDAIARMDPIIADYENNGFYLAYYEAAINAFMKGDYKKAAEYLKPCFDGEYLNYKTANFYALLCKLNQDEETYETVLQVLSNNGAELSPTVEKFLNKQITAEQLFSSDDPFEQPAAESEAEQ